ncbi:MAG: HEAT repeat domain-containing protein [bacterium]|nr:HEAT repeat domain-containing protein [bacterium]
MRRASAPVLAAVVALAGCGGDASPPPDPYRVVIDVGPQIRAFGEDTASADEAGDQLAQLGVPVIPALAAALGREPRDVRVKAVEVLAAIEAPESVPPLLAAARDDADPDVRADALRALGVLADPRARPLLEERLADPDPTVRVGAIMGCATLCTSEAAVARLTDVALDPTQPAVALAARTTLAQLRTQGGEVAAVAERARLAPRQGSTPDGRALAALLASDSHAAAACRRWSRPCRRRRRRFSASWCGARRVRRRDRRAGDGRAAGEPRLDAAALRERRADQAARPRRGAGGGGARGLRGAAAARADAAARVLKKRAAGGVHRRTPPVPWDAGYCCVASATPAAPTTMPERHELVGGVGTPSAASSR